MKPEEMNTESTKFNWKKLLAKKWFFPAAYVATTALILSVAWWYQGEQLSQVTNPNMGISEPADLAMGQMVLPVNSDSQAERRIGFYDDALSAKEKQASLVKYANTYWPHTGCDFARKDGASFDVIASMDGKVIQVNENPVVGRQIEIQHKDGLVTVYQSLGEIKVQKGQLIQKGTILGTAGINPYEKDQKLGNHVHFEVRKNNNPENPEQYFKTN